MLATSGRLIEFRFLPGNHMQRLNLPSLSVTIIVVGASLAQQSTRLVICIVIWEQQHA